MPGFAKGLKRARKKAGYRTQADLAAALDASGLDMTIDTVMNWEQGKSCPSLENFMKLCDFFGCSSDYLLYRIEEKNHDLKYICDYTGLSEEAVEALHWLKETYQQDYIHIIELLLFDALHPQQGRQSRSILSLLYYFFSVDIHNTSVYSVTNTGHILKEPERPTGYIDTAIYFDARINENAALMELQEELTQFKRYYIDKKAKKKS